MRDERRRLVEGIGIGLAAGVVLLAAEMAAAVAAGASPLSPIEYAASLFLGRAAFDSDVATGVAIAGGAVRAVVSALLGIAYVAANTWFAPETQVRWGRQATIGAAYGAIVWTLAYQLIGPTVYAWFDDLPQAPMLVWHVLFFGVPLGLAHALTTRRLRARAGSTPRPR